MKEQIWKVLERYGETVTLQRAEGPLPAKAMLLPETSREEQVPDGMCGIGWLDGRRWQYLGQEEVRPGENLQWRGRRFRVRSSRPFAMGGSILYWWASVEQEAVE